MAQVPTGTLFSVATVLSSAITVTAISNAADAVCTATGHGLTTGDVVQITSGWGRLNKRFFEVETVDANSFKLTNGDTSSTSFFPPGSGAGSAKEVTTWAQLSKVMNPATSGGEPKTVTYKFLESDVEYSINDGFTASSMTLEFDDDDTTAGYTALRGLTDTQSDTCIKQLMRSGSRVYLPCTLALNDIPQLQEGQINRIRAQFNGNARHTRYAA
ncbi:MAG: hypothetical protein KAX65_10185 [Caldilineaceae bacterium]|nr:hypothetical protein [Caldilineaceae bacterium]